MEAMKNYSISSPSSRPPRSEDETAEFISPVGPKNERVVYDKSVLDVGISKDSTRAMKGVGVEEVEETIKFGGRRASWWRGFVQDIRTLWREKAMYYPPGPALAQTVLQA